MFVSNINNPVIYVPYGLVDFVSAFSQYFIRFFLDL